MEESEGFSSVTAEASAEHVREQNTRITPTTNMK
jgi:hypothetical protein